MNVKDIAIHPCQAEMIGSAAASAFPAVAAFGAAVNSPKASTAGKAVDAELE